jgi:hypothetical protein
VYDGSSRTPESSAGTPHTLHGHSDQPGTTAGPLLDEIQFRTGASDLVFVSVHSRRVMAKARLDFLDIADGMLSFIVSTFCKLSFAQAVVTADQCRTRRLLFMIAGSTPTP